MPANSISSCSITHVLSMLSALIEILSHTNEEKKIGISNIALLFLSFSSDIVAVTG